MDFSTANIGLVLVGTFAFATNQGPGKEQLSGSSQFKYTRLNFMKLVSQIGIGYFLESAFEVY